MDTPQWFYGRDGARQGPVSEDELRRLAGAGELRAHDLVWRDGMANWQPAAEVPGLFPDGASVPPPLPPAPPYAPIGRANPPYRPPPSTSVGDDPGMRMLLPVGRSGWAIAAGYLGLLSLLGCVGPIAVVVSIVAIRDIKAHPDRHGMGRAVFGLVMGIVGSLVLVGMIFGALSNR